MNSTFKLIDLSYLESIANGDEKTLKELVNIFIEQVEEFKVQLPIYLKNSAWKELGALAHKTKSSVVAMGMADLGNIDLKNLELIAKQYRIKELNSLKIKTEREDNELEFILAQFKSAKQEQKEWVTKNISLQSIENLIAKISITCDEALDELKTI